MQKQKQKSFTYDFYCYFTLYSFSFKEFFDEKHGFG